MQVADKLQVVEKRSQEGLDILHSTLVNARLETLEVVGVGYGKLRIVFAHGNCCINRAVCSDPPRIFHAIADVHRYRIGIFDASPAIIRSALPALAAVQKRQEKSKRTISPLC